MGCAGGGGGGGIRVSQAKNAMTQGRINSNNGEGEENRRNEPSFCSLQVVVRETKKIPSEKKKRQKMVRGHVCGHIFPHRDTRHLFFVSFITGLYHKATLHSHGYVVHELNTHGGEGRANGSGGWGGVG